MESFKDVLIFLRLSAAVRHFALRCSVPRSRLSLLGSDVAAVAVGLRSLLGPGLGSALVAQIAQIAVESGLVGSAGSARSVERPFRYSRYCSLGP